MAWSDKPTDNQIRAALNLMRWEISNEEVPKIVAYLENNTTRREMSDELGRLRDLKINRKLNRDVAFEGKIWAKYQH